MGAETRNKAADLERDLLTNPQRFSMMQALRLLCYLNASTPEELDQFCRYQIKIVPWLSLAFPPAEVVSIEKEEKNGKPAYRVTVPHYGLYSTMGALPTFYTEELLDEAREDKSISRDFLDIINNHLYHLLYAANRHGDLVRRTVESANRSAEFIQYSMMGQAEETLRDPELPALAVIDLIAQRSRSAIRLERYLEFALKQALGPKEPVRAEVEQCVSRRAPVPSSQRCRLGLNSCRLGEDAVLGESVADSTGAFRIHLYNVRPSDAEKFLPGRKLYRSFREHIRRYLDSPQDFDLVLHPAGDAVPMALGASKIGFYLGAQAVQTVRVSWRGTQHADNGIQTGRERRSRR